MSGNYKKYSYQDSITIKASYISRSLSTLYLSCIHDFDFLFYISYFFRYSRSLSVSLSIYLSSSYFFGFPLSFIFHISFIFLKASLFPLCLSSSHLSGFSFSYRYVFFPFYLHMFQSFVLFCIWFPLYVSFSSSIAHISSV